MWLKCSFKNNYQESEGKLKDSRYCIVVTPNTSITSLQLCCQAGGCLRRLTPNHATNRFNIVITIVLFFNAIVSLCSHNGLFSRAK